MAVPDDKAALLKAIAQHYQKVLEEFQSVPKAVSSLKTMEGHAKNTQMSLHDLLAYLVGWGQLVLKWNQRRDANLTVDFPETGYKWNELGLLAQKFYTDYQSTDFDVLLQQFQTTVNDIVALIEGKSNQALYEQPWYGKWTLGRMIQFNTSSPYQNARKRIKAWKKEQDF